MAAEASGVIFNIQRYAIHDGSGVRTLVFMKGCPLRCRWCSNPEGQNELPEIGFMESRCVGAATCGAPCVAACPGQAVSLSTEGKPIIDRARCTRSGNCSRACYYGALQVIGRRMTVADVLAEIEKDRPFYRRSGGGVTIGGGEPLLQAQFVTRLLEKCRQRYLHTAIESSAFGSPQHLQQMLAHVDLAYFDLKHMDSEQHRKLTGVGNELILHNLKAVLATQPPCEVILRVTIVPGRNDSEDNLSATARFATEVGCKKLELVPYHRLGASKYRLYGRQYELADLMPPSEQRMRELRNLVESFGLTEMTGRL